MCEKTVADVFGWPKRIPIIQGLVRETRLLLPDVKASVDEAYERGLTEDQKRYMPLDQQEAFIEKRARRLLSPKILARGPRRMELEAMLRTLREERERRGDEWEWGRKEEVRLLKELEELGRE